MKTSPYSLTNNVMIHYSLISFGLTVLIALSLSFIITEKLRDRFISTHGAFYLSLTSTIPENYSELLSALGAEPPYDDTLTETDHSHGEDGWLNFRKDLLQFPTIEEFQILDMMGRSIFRQMNDNAPEIELEEILPSLSKGEFYYKLRSERPLFIIEYYLPVILDDELIGIVEIIDNDPNLIIQISESRRSTLFLTLGGGIFFYISLFTLFLRVYLGQKKAIKDLDISQSMTVRAMSRLAELKDDNTGAHIDRTSHYCEALGSELMEDAQFKGYITKTYLHDLKRSAPLHDIGKVGIPDHILFKPGPLSNEEFRIIKTHPDLGVKVLDKTSSQESKSFFSIGYEIVKHHHENWDGSGYPDGLRGEEIPLSARIMAVADVYDALSTERPYKKPFPHKKVMEIMIADKGKKFDPRLIEALINAEDKFKAIARKYRG